MKTIKVVITTSLGQELWGNLYIPDDTRIQDLLNDERAFLPLQILNESRGRKSIDDYSTIIIGKQYIVTVEER